MHVFRYDFHFDDEDGFGITFMKDALRQQHIRKLTGPMFFASLEDDRVALPHLEASFSKDLKRSSNAPEEDNDCQQLVHPSHSIGFSTNFQIQLTFSTIAMHKTIMMKNTTCTCQDIRYVSIHARLPAAYSRHFRISAPVDIVCLIVIMTSGQIGRLPL